MDLGLCSRVRATACSPRSSRGAPGLCRPSPVVPGVRPAWERGCAGCPLVTPSESPVRRTELALPRDLSQEPGELSISGGAVHRRVEATASGHVCTARDLGLLCR
jgi:hypothetical protein